MPAAVPAPDRSAEHTELPGRNAEGQDLNRMRRRQRRKQDQRPGVRSRRLQAASSPGPLSRSACWSVARYPLPSWPHRRAPGRDPPRVPDRYVGIVLASNEVSASSSRTGRRCRPFDSFTRVCVRLDALVDALFGPRGTAARPGARHHRHALRGGDVHVLPARGGRPGQASGHRPRDGHRSDQLTGSVAALGPDELADQPSPAIFSARCILDLCVTWA